MASNGTFSFMCPCQKRPSVIWTYLTRSQSLLWMYNIGIIAKFASQLPYCVKGTWARD